MKLDKLLSKMYPITSKIDNLNDFTQSILNRTLGMFEYTGLPDSLPQVEIEKRLQLKGHATIFEYKGKLYVTTGAYAGMEKSPYNQPTQVIVNVPAFNLNQTLDINKNCVVIKNDSLGAGLLTTIVKHGTLMIENEITMLIKDYNSRVETVFVGGTDQTVDSANTYIKNLVDGNLGVVAENSFLQDLKVQNSQGTNTTPYTDLIQYQQFLKSDLYNELGLSSLNNMKKERMNVDEVNANNDNIYPLIDDMIKNRMDGIKMVNKLFNGNIQVDYSGTWKDKADNRNTPDQEQQPKQQQNTVDNPQQPEQPKQEQPKQEQPEQPKQQEQQEKPKQKEDN